MTRAGRAPDTRTWAAAPDGVVIVDKPAGMTSHDVVGKIRWLARTKRVGHAGTLDPGATGVLVVGVGRATRLLTYLTGADKDYLATVRLGQGTATEDADGPVTASPGVRPDLDQAAVQAAATRLTGDIMQVPSAISAIKIDGERAYKRVRAGEDVVIPARPVHIDRFDVLDVRPAVAEDSTAVLDVDIAVTCSSGTYIRALGRDLAAALGTVGHLTALRRTRVGGADVAHAASLEELRARTEAAGALPVRPLAQAAAGVMPVVQADASAVGELVHGRPIGQFGQQGPHAAIGPNGALVAVVEDRTVKGVTGAWPSVVFAGAADE